jgi:hypothetical protein
MATAALVHPDAPRQGVIARHPLLSFFLLTFLISWGWWALWGALQLPTPLIYVRTAGPTIAAFVVLAIASGRPGVVGLLRSGHRLWHRGIGHHHRDPGTTELRALRAGSGTPCHVRDSPVIHAAGTLQPRPHFLPLFTGVRGIGFLRTSPLRSSRKFGASLGF